MSLSAPQSKVPSPARSPRVSMVGERPAVPHPTNKPAGIINMGMTCFLNSTFQSLAATPALISLLRSNPALPLHPAPDSQLPIPVQSAEATPCLRRDSLEPPLYPLLPVTRAFTNMMHKAWTMHDSGGGTSGPGESSTRHSMTLRSLLKELARKYDQYDEFAQQDAHELLRHLLDSMEMEEKDVIKRINQSRTDTSSPATPLRIPSSSPAAANDAQLEPEVELIPFVDVLFGGLLASVVVCETCKSVSHTYEGFLDISLSMRGDDDAPSRQRKRDRFKGLASRLTPRGNKFHDHTHATMSEPEGSDTEHGRKHLGIGHGRPRPPPQNLTPDTDSGQDGKDGSGSGLSRSASSRIGSRVRPSFSFRKKKEDKDKKGSKSANVSPSISPQVDAGLAKLEEAPPLPESGPPTPRPSSPAPPSEYNLTSSLHSLPSQPSAGHHHHHNHTHQAGAPTPAQAAYIQRILYGPPGAPEANDPLAKLRAAHAGVATPPKDYGLIDSLKNFTAVEVLEGDNAFACHKCWKIKMGRYSQPRREAHSESQNGHADVPSIAVDNTDGDSDGRSRSIPRSPGIMRAPSPLRQVVDRMKGERSVDNEQLVPSSESETSLASSVLSPTHSHPTGSSSLTNVTSTGGLSVDSFGSSTSASTATTTATLASSSSGSTAFPRADSDTDGLSDSSSSDDEPQPDPATVRHSLFRPPFSRTQSRNKHFILRRAFKRYLIAKAPEVLVFHIKRFKQTTSAVYSTFSSLKKLDDFVSFPQTLDLAPFMAPNRNDFKVVPTPNGPRAPYQDWPSPEQCPNRDPMPYTLYAVVVHLGTMIGGHYIAYVLVDPERLFTPPGEVPAASVAESLERLTVNGSGTWEDRSPEEEDGKRGKKKDRRVWCYCSDTEIRAASVQEVMAAKAYLCFYEKSF